MPDYDLIHVRCEGGYPHVGPYQLVACGLNLILWAFNFLVLALEGGQTKRDLFICVLLVLHYPIAAFAMKLVHKADTSNMSSMMQNRYEGQLRKDNSHMKVVCCFGRLVYLTNVGWVLLAMDGWHTCMNPTVTLSDQHRDEATHFTVVRAVLSLCFATGMVSMIVKYFIQVRRLSLEGMDRLVNELEPCGKRNSDEVSGGGNNCSTSISEIGEELIDWDRMKAKVDLECVCVKRLLGYDEIGGFLMCLTLLSFSFIPSGAFTMLTQDFMSKDYIHGIAMFFFGGLCIVTILYMLSELSARINCTGIESRSIVSAACRYTHFLVQGELMPDRLQALEWQGNTIAPGAYSSKQHQEERQKMQEEWKKLGDHKQELMMQAHQRFMQSLLHTPRGTEILGVVISRDVVYTLFMRFFVYLPTMMVVINRAARSDAWETPSLS